MRVKVLFIFVFCLALVVPTSAQSQAKLTCKDFANYHHKADWFGPEFTVTGLAIGADNCEVVKSPTGAWRFGIPLRRLPMFKAYTGVLPPYMDAPVSYDLWYRQVGNNKLVATQIQEFAPGTVVLSGIPILKGYIEIGWTAVPISSETDVPLFAFWNNGGWTEGIILANGEIVVIMPDNN